MEKLLIKKEDVQTILNEIVEIRSAASMALKNCNNLINFCQSAVVAMEEKKEEKPVDAAAQ